MSNLESLDLVTNIMSLNPMAHVFNLDQFTLGLNNFDNFFQLISVQDEILQKSLQTHYFKDI